MTRSAHGSVERRERLVVRASAAVLCCSREEDRS
jgi:hypothetical protein